MNKDMKKLYKVVAVTVPFGVDFAYNKEFYIVAESICDVVRKCKETSTEPIDVQKVELIADWRSLII